MSSSANRRPRVAGQRRRPGRPTGPEASAEPQASGGEARADLDPEAAVEPDADADTADDTTGDAETGTDVDPDGAPADAASGMGTRRLGGGRRLLVPALALALSLALLAAVLVVTRNDPEERPRAASAAVATARSTLEQILSYNHATMAQQVPASQVLLTGSFKKEFGETMTKTIVPLAQKDKTVVKARVYEAGVMSQADGTVTVQAFVNQAKTSDAQKEPSIDQNRVIATMTKVGNRWLVSALKAY